MLALTIDQKEKYFKANGMICPVCGNENTECYDHEYDSQYVHGYNWCPNCHSKWIDTFVLKDVELKDDENA